MGISKFPKPLQLWGPITLCANLWLRWGYKKSYIPHWDLSNGMWHVTCTQGNQGDSWLLVIGSLNANLTPNPSFGHNLCFNYLNGSCKHILDIYVHRAFQWYKELFNLMGFDPYNCFMKIRKSIENPIPKVGAHLRVWRFIPSQSPTLPGAWDVTLGLPSWPAPLQTLALVASPRLGLWLFCIFLQQFWSIMHELFAQPLFYKFTYTTHELKIQPLFHKLVCVTMLISSLQ